MIGFLKKQLFKRVTIVGTGLIGASIGMALKKQNLVGRITGVSKRNESLILAKEKKAIDESAHDLKKAVAGADLIILATPVGTIKSYVRSLAKMAKRGVIITDVGSTKSDIVSIAENHLSTAALFVGSHPLAGSEKTGVANAREDFFENSTCIMTPTEKTNRLAKDKVKQLWTCLGAEVKMMTPEEHDQMLAYISHLPHLLAYGLVGAVPEDFLKDASTGLKDTSRIAASDPQMWSDICLSNKQHIVKSLDSFVNLASKYRKAIIADDEKALVNYFKTSKTKRDKLSAQ